MRRSRNWKLGVCSASVLGGCLAFAAIAHAAAEKETEHYTLFATTQPAQIVQGASAVYTLRITPKGLLKLKRETPLTAVLTPTPGMTLTQDRFSAKDVQDDPPLQKDQAPNKDGKPSIATKRLETAFVAQAAGNQSIRAQLTFFLCTDQICQRYKDSLELPISVGRR